jgi:hypothetical protein
MGCINARKLAPEKERKGYVIGAEYREIPIALYPAF